MVYLGGSRVQARCAREQVNVVLPATIRDVVTLIGDRHPALKPLLVSVRWARNQTLVDLDEPIADGDEIALLPPVAGGAARARVVTDPLDVGMILSEVQSPDCGAVVSFVGTVRDNARGRRVSQITYEAYEPMATKQLDAIAVQCEKQFPGARIVVVHRHGVLKVGEAAIVIAVASPHRDAAFGACREMLERIKVDVPIWKNELAEDGESWVGWGGG